MAAWCAVVLLAHLPLQILWSAAVLESDSCNHVCFQAFFNLLNILSGEIWSGEILNLWHWPQGHRSMEEMDYLMCRSQDVMNCKLRQMQTVSILSLQLEDWQTLILALNLVVSFVVSCDGCDWQRYETALSCSRNKDARLQLGAPCGWIACKSVDL